MKKNIFEEAMLEKVLFGFDVITSSGTEPVEPSSVLDDYSQSTVPSATDNGTWWSY